MGKSQFWGDPRVNPSFSTRWGLMVDKPEGPIASRCSSHCLKQNPAAWTDIDVANPWLKPFGKIGLHSCCFFMFFPHLCKRLQDGKRSQDSSPTGPAPFRNWPHPWIANGPVWRAKNLWWNGCTKLGTHDSYFYHYSIHFNTFHRKVSAGFSGSMFGIGRTL